MTIRSAQRVILVVRAKKINSGHRILFVASPCNFGELLRDPRQTFDLSPPPPQSMSTHPAPRITRPGHHGYPFSFAHTIVCGVCRASNCSASRASSELHILLRPPFAPTISYPQSPPQTVIKSTPAAPSDWPAQCHKSEPGLLFSWLLRTFATTSLCLCNGWRWLQEIGMRCHPSGAGVLKCVV